MRQTTNSVKIKTRYIFNESPVSSKGNSGMNNSYKSCLFDKIRIISFKLESNYFVDNQTSHFLCLY